MPVMSDTSLSAPRARKPGLTWGLEGVEPPKKNPNTSTSQLKEKLEANGRRPPRTGSNYENYYNGAGLVHNNNSEDSFIKLQLARLRLRLLLLGSVGSCWRVCWCIWSWDKRCGEELYGRVHFFLDRVQLFRCVPIGEATRHLGQGN